MISHFFLTPLEFDRKAHLFFTPQTVSLFTRNCSPTLPNFQTANITTSEIVLKGKIVKQPQTSKQNT